MFSNTFRGNLPSIIKSIQFVIGPSSSKTDNILFLIIFFDNFFLCIDKLLSKKIAITGKLSSISRDKLKSDLEELGVKVVSSISKNTDYVIVGDDAGSKLEKAKALNIEIIYDKDLSSFLKFTT